MLFQKKTVATVIAGFNTVCDDLDAVASAAVIRTDEIADELDQLQAEQSACDEEVRRADSIRANILKMLEG